MSWGLPWIGDAEWSSEFVSDGKKDDLVWHHEMMNVKIS